MDRQPLLQTKLEQLVSDDPADKLTVYFQPPVGIELKYPCIMYSREQGATTFAGNKPYRHTRRYQVIMISRDVDWDVYDLIANLPMCTHVRWYAAEKLNHDVFTLYF